jgi:hypothetical protein
MECDPDYDEETSNDRRLPSLLRRYRNPACELPRNREEQEDDAGDHEEGRDWRIL